MLLFVLLNLHYPFPEAPLAISGHSISVLGSEEVAVRIEWIYRERKGGRKGERQTEEKQGGRRDKGVTPGGVERSCHILTP